jgi:3-deoxy-D-manno-octulosonate 8-phosphate phosphatase (KDO 8-P phosphatase)
VAVPNACPEAKAVAAYVTRTAGGRGAIRELVELILKSQGKWEDALAEFF